METGMLKEEVMKIEIPEVMKERIAAQCTSRMQEGGKAGFRLRPASVSALFLICFALAGVSGLAYGKLQGYFRDVKNPIGAVTGTAYEDADEEIMISAERKDGRIIAGITFADKEMFPYRELELIRITEYELQDEDGVVIPAEAGDAAVIKDGTACVTLRADIPAGGRYTLIITELEGLKKADQPLKIHGTWECSFSAE
ncbi:MAG: hypothetical protein E7190_08720 [Erysipelotrichaceae bacterium]|nr:hypothetical protein [Erysipelotrichaceae bacterium]